jgi:phage baseplate assembly protein W
MSTPAALPPAPPRHDFAFPFRVDPVSQQTAQAAYPAHVEQMVRQLLLTTPGERVNLPQFGCGLRGLVFSPLSDALAATVKLRVLQALDQWLAGIVAVGEVAVSSSRENALLEPGTITVSVTYTLIETQSTENVTVTVL